MNKGENHMKKGALAAIAVASFTAAAAQAADAKIAVFDAQDVINDTNAAKRAVTSLTGKRDAAQAKIDALKKPLIDKQNKLREQQGVLSAEKFQAAQAEFSKELAKFRTDAQNIQNDLDNENAKVRKELDDAVHTAVEALAKEKGYDLILPKGMTFYTSTNVPDISSEVLARTNKLLDK